MLFVSTSETFTKQARIRSLSLEKCDKARKFRENSGETIFLGKMGAPNTSAKDKKRKENKNFGHKYRFTDTLRQLPKLETSKNLRSARVLSHTSWAESINRCGTQKINRIFCKK